LSAGSGSLRISELYVQVKNVTLQAGSESKKGGRYRILDEKIEDDILTVHFESAW
jgi:hypothetical protein